MALIWSLWLCRNDKVFDKKSFSLAVYLPLYGHSRTMVTASPYGVPQSLFGGVHVSGGYCERPFLVAWMAA
jgi:hypothetical protein